MRKMWIFIYYVRNIFFQITPFFRLIYIIPTFSFYRIFVVVTFHINFKNEINGYEKTFLKNGKSNERSDEC